MQTTELGAKAGAAQELATLRAFIEAQLLAALPMQMDAKLASEAKTLMAELVNDILAQCAHDPANSLSIAQTAVSAALPRLKGRFNTASEKAHLTRRESAAAAKKTSKKSKATVARDHVVVHQALNEQWNGPAALTDVEYSHINAQADALFGTETSQLQFVMQDGEDYWRIELGEGRYALVPAQGIEMVQVSYDPARGYFIEHYTTPVAYGGSIQSQRVQMRLTPEQLAPVVGVFASPQELAERLRANQALMQQVQQAYAQEQKRQFDALVQESAQCAFHGYMQPLAFDDMWQLPQSFAPEETPEDAMVQTPPHLSMVH